MVKTTLKGFLSQKVYDFIYNRVPRACVDMIFMNEEGNMLLAQRNIEPYKGFWSFPGGGIKFKETIADAAKRIARKELNVEVEIIQIT